MIPKFMQTRRRGSLLLLTVIFGALLGMMMIPMMQHAQRNTQMAFGTRASDQAFYAAEAGVARTLSFIYGAGAGSITGIYDPRFAVTEDQAFYPFGENWVTLDPGITTNALASVASRTRIWSNPGTGTWSVESVGRSLKPRQIFRTVTVTIGAGSFARYAFFNTASLSAIDGRPRWLAAGETFNGPVHSNRHLFVYGTSTPNNPLTFNSDVEIVSLEARSGNANNQNVVYNGLLDTNADYIELPSDLDSLIEAAASGGIDLPGDDPWLASAPPEFFTDESTPDINNYRFEFNANGTVDVVNIDAMNFLIDGGTSPAAALIQTTTNFDLSAMNGAIIVRDGNIFVSGIVNGRVTLGALANDASQAIIPPFASVPSDGNVILEGELIYSTHPLVNGQYDISDNRNFAPGVVTDVLGLIAERNFVVDGSMPAEGIVDAHIMVTGQASPNPDVRGWGPSLGRINAAINQDGGFYIEDGNQRDLSELWTGVPDSEPGSGNRTGSWKFGDLYLTGGVVHFLRGQTKNGSGGFSRHYTFDSRLLVQPPPFYPLTPDLAVIGWRDVASTTAP